MKYLFGDASQNCRDTQVVVENGKITSISVVYYDPADISSYNGVGGKSYKSVEEYLNDVPVEERDVTPEQLRECELALPGLLSAKVKELTVHAGLFHMDDILCAALCRLNDPTCRIIRSNKPDTEAEGLGGWRAIADVGGVYDPDRWLFDHHQDRYTPDSDPNTVRAAVGRLWDTLGDSAKYPSLTTYIRAVDLHDTGVSWTPLGVVGSFAPNWDEEFTMDGGFEVAVAYVMKLVRRLVRKDQAAARAAEELDRELVADGIVVLDRFLPWQDWAAHRSDVRAVVSPGREPGEWNVNIPKGRGTFPKDWLENKPASVTFVTNWLTMICVNDLTVIADLVNQIVTG